MVLFVNKVVGKWWATLLAVLWVADRRRALGRATRAIF
jgi:hypothetical protein